MDRVTGKGTCDGQSLARYVENLRPSPANHPIHLIRTPIHGQPSLFLARFRLLARSHTRSCTSMYVHAHAYAHPTAAGFPVSSSLSSWPTLPLPCLPRLRSALSYDRIGPDLTWPCTFPPQPDRKTTHAFAWSSPAPNKYIPARQSVLLSKYLPCPLFVPSSLASRRIGAPSGPAHFPMPAAPAAAAAAPTLFKVVLSAILPVCPSTVDIGPRQHTGKLDR